MSDVTSEPGTAGTPDQQDEALEAIAASLDGEMGESAPPDDGCAGGMDEAEWVPHADVSVAEEPGADVAVTEEPAVITSEADAPEQSVSQVDTPQEPAEAAEASVPTTDHLLPAAEAAHVLPPAAEQVSGPSEPDPDSVPAWPFIAYAAIWLLFAILIVARFSQVPLGQPIYEAAEYPLSVLAGLTLSIAGPLVILTAWFGSWGTPGSTKWGLFVSALIKGSLATTFGVALWWFALIIVDQVRMGRVL